MACTPRCARPARKYLCTPPHACPQMARVKVVTDKEKKEKKKEKRAKLNERKAELEVRPPGMHALARPTC